MINVKQNQSGQSLIEMLIAIFILIVALTATIVLVVTSIQAGRDSINKLIATNLAREGVEVVRNIRDGNWIEPDNIEVWDNGLDSGIMIPTIVPFGLSSDTIALVASTGFDDPEARINYSPDNNFYYQNYSGAPLDEEPTNFFRVIYLSNICQDDVGNEGIVDLGSSDDCNTAYGGTYNKVGIRVISEVRWPNATSGRKVQVEERLYNWQSL
ncbi:MAG: prepilin-type N-terminal cleavage/methylation domain-containing protein [bacterium]|nr:prepilin-type N-terminal cleavage/methylation domain-containing protein [bacterium]